MPRTVRWILALAVGLVGVLFVSAPAPAYTAHGKRCTIVGTNHKDVLTGTGRNDVICGRGGNDVIRARGGKDVVDGGAGRDRIDGGPGADELRGGSGGDAILGGGGSDDLFGEAGNDDLSGGPAADDLVGGSGTNWCTVDAADDKVACVYDRRAPVVVGASISPQRVDVSDGGKNVTVRVHITDDTGVAHVDLQGDLALVSGDVRDGWWEGPVSVGRWTAPGPMRLSPAVRDRAGRWAAPGDLPATLTVVNTAPDAAAPRVTTLLSPTTSTTVDVRTAARDVIVKARVSDAGSGVFYVMFCLYHPASWGYTNLQCLNGDRVSGSAHDGAYQTAIRIPRRSVGGAWDVSVVPVDNAGNQATYGGPHLVDESTIALPGGGTFNVQGISDTHLPAVTNVTLTPTTVDTLGAPARITVRVAATDVEGATSVSAMLSGEQAADWSVVESPLIDLKLSSGTAQNGVWTGTLELPQGAPPGVYWLWIGVSDIVHAVSYLAPDDTRWVDGQQQAVPGSDRVTVVPHT